MTTDAMKNQPLTIQFFNHEPMTLNSITPLQKSTHHALMTEHEVSTYSAYADAVSITGAKLD
jgi:hypothetical protein